MKYYKVWRWIIAAAVVLLAAMAVVPALWGRHEAETTVEKDITINLVYAFQNRQWSACVEEVVRQFEQTHPGVHIAYEIQYEDEVYEDTLTKLVARDELGDIVQLKEPLRFAKSGLFTPLGVGGGDLWHMEYWLNHFLRSDVLSREPDFLAQCKAGERDWSDPLITEMLVHIAQLFRRGYVDSDWLNTPDAALAYHLAEEEVAMVFSGPWLIRDALALNPSLELGWFYVPNEDGQVVAGESVDVFWAVSAGCARDAERYEAACDFLEFFYSEGVYEEVCASMAGFSTLADQGRGRYETSAAIGEMAAAREGADLRFTAYVGDGDTPPGFEKRLLETLMELCRGSLDLEEAQALCVEYWEQEAAYE